MSWQRKLSLLSAGAILAATTLVTVNAYAQAPAAPVTPRGADGHPDLSGLWTNGAGGEGARLPTGEGGANFAGRGGDFFGFEEDNGLSRMSLHAGPVYKPQYWDQVQLNDYNGNWDDPVHQCYPAGPAELGMPKQIIKVEGQPALLLVYQAGFAGYLNRYLNQNQYRWVWTDGRPHDPAIVAAESYQGDAVGHWEGDTLVIETVGLTDENWLGRQGWIHGYNMKVTERLTRTGNTLTWNATAEDPDYFLEPWVLQPMTANLNTRPGAVIGPMLPCADFDAPNLTSPTQSG
jgi:hypothetical protein